MVEVAVVVSVVSARIPIVAKKGNYVSIKKLVIVPGIARESNLSYLSLSLSFSDNKLPVAIPS